MSHSERDVNHVVIAITAFHIFIFICSSYDIYFIYFYLRLVNVIHASVFMWNFVISALSVYHFSARRENMAYHGELSRTLTNQLKINGYDMISAALKENGYESRTHKKCIA